MKLNVDLRQSNGYGGISNYIRNLSAMLAKCQNYNISGCSFWYRNMMDSHFSWLESTIKTSLLPERIAYHSKIKIPLSYEFLMDSYADMNIFFSYRLPQVNFISPVVSTIHDIILLKTECETKDFIDKHLKTLQDTIKRSTFLLTVSESSREDISDYFNFNRDKIFIVHNGIDQDIFRKDYSLEDFNRVRKTYNLPQKFILNFGKYRIHKNIEGLLYAYSLLPKSIRNELKLVLTQPHRNIESLSEKLEINSDIFYIGFVEEKDKPIVYKLANSVYYASLYEGFGVPIIESQAAGTPVITSDISSMPEAAGEAAVLVNPYNHKEIADAIETIYTDSLFSNNLSKKGNENSKKYTWNNSLNEFSHFLNAIDSYARK